MEKMNITGMSCGHCVSSVKETLEGMGLTNVDVNLEQAQATFENAKSIKKENIVAAIEDIGFEIE